MAPLFPAIFIGGPPHSGTSMVVYHLSQILHQRGIAHDVLHACLNGAGGWSDDSRPAAATALWRQVTRDGRSDQATALRQTIAERHLPLLVEASGTPSADMESLATVCTHAVLMAPPDADLTLWRALIEGIGLVLVADLIVDRDGVASIINATSTLYGVISSLAPELVPVGPCFDALIGRIAPICAYSADELYRSHLALTDIDLVLHIERAIYPLPQRSGDAWLPSDLPALLASLPTHEPLAIYGAGPTWLYAALSAFNHPYRFELFDMRHGWITPPVLTLGSDYHHNEITLTQSPIASDVIQLHLTLRHGSIEPEEVAGLALPPVTGRQGIVLDGRLPNWLWCSLVRAYTQAAWVGISRPHTHDAVIVSTNDFSLPPLGSLIPLAFTRNE